MKVYVVRGDTGTYSDFMFWEVRAFSDENLAQQLCAQLIEWLKEHRLYRPWYDKRPEMMPIPKKCPLDPGFLCIDGVNYNVWSIEAET